MSDSSLLDPAGSSLQLPLERAAAVSIDERDVAINAWRGFAALLVAYFHCRQITWIGIQQFHKTGARLDLNTVFSYLTFPIAWGSAGVPIFFVISGFVIAYSVRNARVTPGYLANYALRRSVRLDPPYWTTIAFVLLRRSLSSEAIAISNCEPGDEVDVIGRGVVRVNN